jgi:hypothetical protein
VTQHLHTYLFWGHCCAWQYESSLPSLAAEALNKSIAGLRAPLAGRLLFVPSNIDFLRTVRGERCLFKGFMNFNRFCLLLAKSHHVPFIEEKCLTFISSYAYFYWILPHHQPHALASMTTMLEITGSRLELELLTVYTDPIEIC